jgi:tetratricopeptide (TPR) repeat protein
MRRTVDFTFLTVLLAAAVLAGTGLYFLHGFQLRRTAPVLLAEAAQAEQEGQADQALEYLAYYRRCVPENTEVLAWYGRLLEERSDAPQDRRSAYEVYTELLQRDPGNTAIRRRLVRLALDVGELGMARQALDQLQADSPDDGELEDLGGQVHVAAHEYPQAAEWLSRAVQHAPQQLDTYERLARLWRRQLEQPDQADRVMDEMVAANAQLSRAYLLRARYRRELGQLEPAAADLARSRALAPTDPEVLLLAGQVALARSQLDEARGYLQQGLAIAPQRAGLYATLAQLELQGGHRQEALAWLRRGLEAVPNQGELLPLLADLLIQEGQVAEAGKVLGALRQAGFSPAWLAYFEARLLLPRGQSARAAALLEQARSQLTGSHELAGQIELYLGQCYEQLEDPERQLAAYRRAVALDPAGMMAHFRLGSAFLALGRTEEALRELQLLQRLPHAPAAGWALQARALLLRNLGLPSGQRDWREVNQALDRAAQAMPEAIEVPLLRAEALVAQGQPDAARDLLEKARGARPDQVAFWEALALLALREGKPEAAAKVLDEARQPLGDRLELRLAWAAYWASRGGPEAATGLAELEKDRERFGDPEQKRLLGGLAVAHLRIGDPSGAERLWAQLAERQPNDLRTRLLLFDLAIQTGREAALPELVRDIRRVEGDEGALWRYAEARRLILLATRGDRPALDEARRRAAEVAERRPSWSRVPLLQAVLAEQDGNLDKALDHYLQATKQGERRPEVLRRLLELLTERRRYAEADQVLRDLRAQVSLAGALARLGAEVALGTNDPEQALELARQAVPPGSTDYRDHLWLGQALVVLGKRADAEAALRRAVQLGPTAPEAWVALVQLLAGSGQRAEAETAVGEARKALTGEQAPLALAACYEALAQWDEADEQYRAAVTARPDDVVVLRSAASYYLRRRQPQKAVPPLRKLAAPETRAPAGVAAWARRSLALALGTEGDYRQFREALAILGRNLQDRGGTVEDLHTRALLLRVRPGHRREAIRQLEELSRAQPLPPEEEFLLAQLYDAGRDWPKARERLLTLLAADRKNAGYLAYYAGALLRQGEAGAARTWVAELEKVAPNAPATVEVKARLLHAAGKEAEAAALLTAYAQGPGVELPRVAALLEGLGQMQAAEELYRRGAAQPQGTVALAGYLGRHNHLDEAIDLCQQALQEHPRLPALLLALAGFRERQGRYGDAETLYRQVLEREPDNIVALNNLAGLLSGNEGKHAEGLELVQRALDRAGPLPALLDTHAVIALRMGRTDLAVKELEEAVADTPTATRYFHLALACQAARNARAAEVFAKATAAGFEPDSLYAFERAAYQQLVAELKLR